MVSKQEGAQAARPAGTGSGPVTGQRFLRTLDIDAEPLRALDPDLLCLANVNTAGDLERLATRLARRDGG